MMMFDRISLILVILGALNWLVIGLFGFDMVAYLFGGQAQAMSRAVYAIIGVSGLWCVSLLFEGKEVEKE